MNWLSPTLWNNIGVVGLALFVCFSVWRGWLIPKPLHREIVDGKNKALTELQSRADRDAETIQLQAQTINRRDAVEDAVTRLLQATRNAAGDR